MPWIPIYVNEQDARVLVEWLNQAPEIAFIVSDAPQCWKAVSSIQTVTDGDACMWHVPSGPLPLLTGPRQDDPVEQVVSPWEGWRERRPGANGSQPYFGAGHPGVMWLNLRLVCRNIAEKPGAIGMSSIQWIGNHYRLIGNAAKPETEKFWKRLRRFIASHSTRIPRGGPIDGPRPEIYAFESALEEIRNGRARARNPV
jgi:hypothetical protein